jgi:Rrf2 family cysteine metabolism transcriptional repressor
MGSFLDCEDAVIVLLNRPRAAWRKAFRKMEEGVGASDYRLPYCPGTNERVSWRIMRISQKGLYALQATAMLARHYNEGPLRIRDIAAEENLPEKFLELILLDLKYARIVDSVRGARGGYQLRRSPDQIFMSEIMRAMDGPLAMFGDADSLRNLISNDAAHRSLFRVFLRVRDAAAQILEHTSLADICEPEGRSASKAAPRKAPVRSEMARRTKLASQAADTPRPRRET